MGADASLVDVEGKEGLLGRVAARVGWRDSFGFFDLNGYLPRYNAVSGWTPLHWSGFHGQAETAKVLASETKLLWVKDKEGNTPIDMARKEGNDTVAEIYEAALGEGKKSK